MTEALKQIGDRVSSALPGTVSAISLAHGELTVSVEASKILEVLTFLRRAVDEMGQTIVMVTHDPMAASYADRIVFLADGRIVDEMLEPTAERVLERMSRFGE